MDDLGDFTPAPDRADPVALLEEQAQSRVESLVPVRYGRMSVSPFTFYRGAALIMAADIATMPRSGIQTQVCGDAHLLNFGVYGTPERRMVFDINDFDETHPAPFEWDMRRFVASLEVAGRSRGDKKKARRATVEAACTTYVDTLRGLSTMPTLEVWYARLDVDSILATLELDEGRQKTKRARKTVEKFRSRTSLQALRKLTTVESGQLRFRDDPPLLERGENVLKGMSVDQMTALLDATQSAYADTLVSDRRWLLSQYRLVDIARKVVGVGSVGLRCWLGLFTGRDQEDVLFLQFKEAQASVLERFTQPSVFAEHGERVVDGQRLMQAASDLFLGWERTVNPVGPTVDFYVRQLRDWKGSIDVETLTLERFTAYARACAWTLAKAHARSGDRGALATYVEDGTSFTDQMAAFAVSYADQNERDYEEFMAAIASGRITAETGV
jgi:uncharacterized protein (DUF2252 family)